MISMWRIPKFPVGAHMLLSFLAEPLKQPTDTLLSLEEHNIYENMQELEDWVGIHFKMIIPWFCSCLSYFSFVFFVLIVFQ